jgi:hypothetical protein
VVVDQDAKRLLVQSGYDPRMGARPMRRIVQRAVENIVARRMLGGQVMPGEQISITSADVQTILSQESRSFGTGTGSPQQPTPPTTPPVTTESGDNEVSVSLH